MQEIPECLNRRYKALDKLVKELNEYESCTNVDSIDDPSIKLLCDFWNILKEDPDVNLSQAVEQRMCLNIKNSGVFGQQFSCYMAGCDKKNEDKKQETINKIKNICCKQSAEISDKPKCRATKSVTPSSQSGDLPLNKVLCNLKEAATFEKKCHIKVNDLLETQKQLQEQIQTLEQKEKEGIQLLKQADCMWSCMEGAYKKKVAESIDRQKELLKKLKETEESNAKWRKNKKDLEFEMDNVNKCQQEITEKISHKESDIKCIDMEMENFKKRIETNKKDIEETKKSFVTKKKISDGKITSIAKEVTRLEKVLQDELKYQKIKEEEGSKFVKEARGDLQKLCKVLLQKKLENEDMRAERDALLLEIDLLNQTSNQCKDTCKNKQETIDEEIKAIDKEIAEFKIKCIRCHECTDTVDVRKFCTDCPRCVNVRDCLYKGDHCSPDRSMDCVCTSVKQKFLDNVFDNMYTTLERQVKTGSGKTVADAVLNCLRKSRNGKLNTETKKVLQDFILSTIKKNLNLTIVGGAIKTRCEMDSETYKQLMLCLKQVKVVKPEKIDQSTDSMKEPCTRWGGRSECNCPKGPKECICTKKAQPSLNEPTSCPPEIQEKTDTGERILCPYKETAVCGPDCARHELPSSVASEVASWRPNPCQGPTCHFKNMRAAQCVLGPESISSSIPRIIQNQTSCKCDQSSTASCVCIDDTKQLKADKTNICDNGICENVNELVINRNEHEVKQIKQKPNRCVDVTQQKNELTSNKNLERKIMQKPEDGSSNYLHTYIADSKNDRVEIISHRNLDLRPLNNNKHILPKKVSSLNLVKKESKLIPKVAVNDAKTSKLKLNLEKSSTHVSGNKNASDFYINKGKVEKRKGNCNNYEKSKIYKVKIKGIDKTLNEPIFVLRRTNSDNFEVILDKEYRKFYKKAIKENHDENNMEYTHLMKSDSGHFIIDLKENCKYDSNHEKALLIKSPSGNIKVLVDKSQASKNLMTSKSVMTPQNISQLLNSYSSPYSSTQIGHEKLKKPRVGTTKSISDSNLLNKAKAKIRSNQSFSNIPSEVKECINKGIATSCIAGISDDSCDKNNCVCKNICYTSKRWLLKNNDKEKFISKCCAANIDKFNTHTEKPTKYGEKCSNSNEDDTKEENSYLIEKNSQISNDTVISEQYPLEVSMNPTVPQWNSLNYLPPQLPSFLRDFEFF